MELSVRNDGAYCSTKRPYVYRNCPSRVEHDFRGTIYGGAYYMLPIVCIHILRNGVSEVAKLNSAGTSVPIMLVYEDVVRFDVCSHEHEYDGKDVPERRLGTDQCVLVCGHAKRLDHRELFSLPA